MRFLCLFDYNTDRLNYPWGVARVGKGLFSLAPHVDAEGTGVRGILQR